jgi:hypothetical protein
MVPSGRLAFPGLCGLVRVLVFILESLRLAGGTDCATEAGRLGGALEPALETGGNLVGVAGVARSRRYI